MPDVDPILFYPKPKSNGYTETEYFVTDIYSSINGTENRQSLIDKPKFKWSYTLMPPSAEEFQVWANLIRYAIKHRIYQPIWSSLSYTNDQMDESTFINCPTDYKEFAVGDHVAVIYGDVMRIGAVVGVVNGRVQCYPALEYAFPIGSMVLPLRIATLDKSNSWNYITPRKGTFTVSAQELASGYTTIPTESNTTYLGYPLFPYRPMTLVNGAISNEFMILGEEYLPNRKFNFEPQDDLMGDWVFRTKDEAVRWGHKAFFRNRKGRYAPFWLRSWKKDYTLTAPSYTTNTTITVKGLNAGSISDLNLSEMTRHLYISPLDQCVKITGGDDNGNGTFDLAIDPGLSGDLPLGSEIMNLLYVRYNTDSMVTRWLESEIADITLNFRELQMETP